MCIFLFLGASLFHYIAAPVATMRSEPNNESEIASQAIFSEEVTLGETQNDWVYVETPLDHYHGWVKRDAICGRQNQFGLDSSKVYAKVNRLKAHVYSVTDTIYGPVMSLPYESKVELIDAESPNSRWVHVQLCNGQKAYIQRGDLDFDMRILNIDEMCQLSTKFLGLPYTWGGRSSFGYDCSGFVQMLYRQMGIRLPRDAKDQMKWDGFSSTTLDQLSPGDLLFFGASIDRITHVGLYLHNGEFIHADVHENAPYIRINRLSDALWNESDTFPFRTFRTLINNSGSDTCNS